MHVAPDWAPWHHDFVLPALPAHHTEAAQGTAIWSYPKRAEAETRALMNAMPPMWKRIVRELGGGIDDGVRIRIGLDPEEMRALAPIGAPPPPDAVGVAYPAAGLILLTLTAPNTWQRPPMEQVLAHELSHVALHRAVGGAEIPRWFAEGVAAEQAGEYNLEQAKLLGEAASAGRLYPLSDLSGGFAQQGSALHLAYAEAAHFVAYLNREPERFSQAIRELRAGQPLESAIAASYGESLQAIETRWRSGLDGVHATYALWVAGGAIWLAATGLLLIAWRRQKRQTRQTLASWEEDDRAIDALEATIQARLDALHEGALHESHLHEGALHENHLHEGALHEGDAHPSEPEASSPNLPTVHPDGRRHTLH